MEYLKNIVSQHFQPKIWISDMICILKALPALCKGGHFQKLSYGSETLHMTSEGLGQMFEGDFADTCANKFPIALIGGKWTLQACADGEQ